MNKSTRSPFAEKNTFEAEGLADKKEKRPPQLVVAELGYGLRAVNTQYAVGFNAMGQVFPRSTPDMLALRAYANPDIQSLPLGVWFANIVPRLQTGSIISSQGNIPPRRYAQSGNFAFGEGRLCSCVRVRDQNPISKEKTDR